MWIPHTIPPVIFRAYTQTVDSDTLKQQYEGRNLRSEDPNWHVGIASCEKISLALLCLEMIIDGYEYYVELTKCRNYLLQRKCFINVCEDFIEEGIGETGGEIVAKEKSEEILASKCISEKVENKVVEVYPLLPNVLDRLSTMQRMVVIEELDVEQISFRAAVETIPDDFYWQRAVATLFPDSFHEESTWRKTYLKMYTENYMEQFNPREDRLKDLIKIIRLVAFEVTSLNIEQLLPFCYGAETEAAVHVPFAEDEELGEGDALEFDEGFSKADELLEKVYRKKSVSIRKPSEARDIEIDDDNFILPDDSESRLSISEIMSSTRSKSNSVVSVKEIAKLDSEVVSVENSTHATDPCNHVDLSEILPLLFCLREISIVYEVKDVGFEWEESFFKFTDDDCINLAKGLKNSPTLETLALNRSHVNGNQFNILVLEGIVHMPKIAKINFSYNDLGDTGAQAIKHLMVNSKSDSLKSIILCRNGITDEGAVCIGEALKVNDCVTDMDLRLNFIGNAGCNSIAEGLSNNKSLQKLSLCGNRLESPCCYSIGKLLTKNSGLKELDLSCNKFDNEGGEYLYHGAKYNTSLQKLNITLSGIGSDLEYNIKKFVGCHPRKRISKEVRQKGWTLVAQHVRFK